MADVFAPQPVKTKVAGDVVVNINAGQTVALSAGSAVIGKAGIDQTTPGVTNGVQVVAALPAGTAVIGKTSIDQTTPGVTNAVQVVAALPAGTNVIGALAANQSVNNAQLGGNAIAVGAGASNTGTQRVILATDQAVLLVTQGLSFTTSDSGQLTSVALAAGATAVLDGPQIASGVGKLFEATVSSSVAIKAQLGTWDGTTFTVKRTFFVPANSALLFEPSRYDSITFPTGATAKFRWSITNNDNANAADVYASITQAI